MSKTMVQRHRDLRRLRESRQKEGRVDVLVRELGEIFSDRSVSLSDFSVRGLFESMVDDGREFIETFFRPSDGGYRMLEDAGAVNTTLFANIQGQYFYNAIMRGYDKPELIGDQLVTVRPTQLSGEKMPGITAIGDQVEVVAEGNPYPRAGMSEYWVETPATIKRGLMLDITKEAVYFDLTGQLLSKAQGIGDSIAVNREKRILDVVFGISTIYRRNGAAPAATYDSTNTTSSNPLVDWVSVDTVDTKFSTMTDPDTGEPIVITPDTLIVPPALTMTATRIANAMMTNQLTGSGSRETRVDGNSVKHPMTVLSSPYVRQRTSSDSTWFRGKPKEAFAYMQNWPIAVEPQPVGSDVQFERDIIYRYKTSERGAAAVIEPRFMVKATA